MAKPVEGPTKNPIDEFLAIFFALLVLALLSGAFFAFLTWQSPGAAP
jgi:hypothetical protein